MPLFFQNQFERRKKKSTKYINTQKRKSTRSNRHGRGVTVKKKSRRFTDQTNVLSRRRVYNSDTLYRGYSRVCNARSVRMINTRRQRVNAIITVGVRTFQSRCTTRAHARTRSYVINYYYHRVDGACPRSRRVAQSCLSRRVCVVR